MRRKNLGGIVLLAVLVLLVVGSIVFYLQRRPPELEPEAKQQPTPTPTVIVQEVETIVEVQAEITQEEICSSLNEMGKMTTAEYLYTGIASSSLDPKSVLGIELGFTGAYVHAKYNGIITAGIDFGRITAQKEEEKKTITVYMPPAEIQSVVIDLDSFELISEQSSIFARISFEDYNKSMVELETEARDRAIELNLLERADETAKLLIQRFVHSLVGSDYTVEILSAEGKEVSP